MICLRQVLSSTKGLQLEFLFIPKYLFPAENRSTGFERPRPAIAIKIAANWSKGVYKIILISMPPPKPAVKIMFCVRQVWSVTGGLQLDVLFIPKYLFQTEDRSTGDEQPRPVIIITITANWSKGVCKIMLVSMPAPQLGVNIM